MVAVLAAAPGASTGHLTTNHNNNNHSNNNRNLSISTSFSRDASSAGSPPASPSQVSTPTSSCGNAPPTVIRPITIAGRPPSIKASPAATNMASPPATSPAAASQPVALSMTSKEWVIPPRPKPGRKPATDTPPTKRKAQNRAAQRAFRERRAARVGELEEQLEEQKEEHDRIVREMQERIDHLEIERQTLQSRCQSLEEQLERERQGRDSVSAPSWDNSRLAPSSGDGGLMSTRLHQQQQTSVNMASHAAARPIQPAPSKNATPNSVPIAEPRPITQPFSISQIISPQEQSNAPLGLSCGGCQTIGSCACAEEILQQNSDVPIGCGGCTLGGRCACLEESIKSAIASDLKRRRGSGSLSPSGQDEKRQRSDVGLNLETDFTALFAAKDSIRMPSMQSTNQSHPVHHNHHQQQQQPQQQQQLSIQPLLSLETRDCGFCKDGTYCICADMMGTTVPTVEVPVSQPAPVVQHTQTHTPPPSDDDVIPMPMEVTATGAIKLPGPRNRPNTQSKPATVTKPTGGCGPSGPGTCAQCLSDPKSGLFCRSLAANFEKNNPGSSAAGGCCGSGGPGGCCKTAKAETTNTNDNINNNNTLPPIQNPSNTGFGLSLSCADAFKTLASHRHFEEAADDIGSWLPKLRALPVLRQGGNAGAGGRGPTAPMGGRAPIEVEAASIMSVLKDFDVRFGRGE
ncbi:hypothetical protein QBC42DRAFT_36509 [Cladorrhinum samala]|uniref:BZIP domain-containing protein n=1 Tax=Cladorrhinum samala TaxID=585594 RepID=A0AAV9I0I7_9PEZI|nr:hypothetical protein QBC42DRAFT_36509 [Cladorrhinum samala]